MKIVSKTNLNSVIMWVIAILGVVDYAAAQESLGKITNFNIQSKSMGDALNDFARQSDTQLLFRSDLGNDITAPAVYGNLSPVQALEKLLDKSGLDYEFVNSRIVGIHPSVDARMIPTEGKERSFGNQKGAASGRTFLLAARESAAGAPQGRSESNAAKNEKRTDRKILEEIIVTAQKRAESLQDVPISIAAFSGEYLKNFGVTTTKDLQILTPGMVFNNSSNGQIYLRGIGTQYSINGLDPSVATYIDDRYIARDTTTVVDLFDVERIEVLKGPQGTLFGRNTAGGAIRVITKDVSDEFEGKVAGSFGNYDYYSVSGMINLPLTDNFGARIVGATKQRDGFADNLSPIGDPEWDDLDFKIIGGKFRWDMTENVTARLSLSYWEANDHSGLDTVVLHPVELARGIALGGYSGRDVDEVATSIDQKDDQEEFSTQLRIDAGFDGFNLVSITTYSDLDQIWGNGESDGTNLPLLDFSVPESGDDFSQEFQLLSNKNGNWNWVVGGYYYESDFDTDVLIDVNLPFMISSAVQKVETTSWAAFGQTTWDINDRWSLTLGGRWTKEEKEVENLASTRVPLTVVPVPFRDKDDWGEFTPRASLQYRFENSQVYLTYARGFKSGGFNYPATTSIKLDPEILDMVELGFKGEFFEQRLRLDTAFYHYDFSDLQVTRAATESGLSTTENAADSKVLGFDLNVMWLVTDRMILQTGLNVLDTEYENFPDASVKIFNAVLTGDPTVPGMGQRPYDVSGYPMLRAPDWSAYVSLQYDFQLRDGRMPLHVAYSYKDEYDFDFVVDPLSEAMRQDSYGLLSARLSYIPPGEKWELALWGNNLADEEYFDSIIGNAQGIRGNWGEPRTFGVDITFNF